MAKSYYKLGDRSNNLLANLMCRTDADTEEAVIRKALQVYNLVGTAIEQGHKVVIGSEPINLMEFHPIVPEAPVGPKLAEPEQETA